MKAQKTDFGIVGLGVMGKNLLLNIADKGYSVIGLDRNLDKTVAVESENSRGVLHATTSVNEFVSALEKPRKIMMLVPAGAPVDTVIEQLLPHLEEGDLLLDGGNSHFHDTDTRYDALTKKGIHYMGVGISGGEEGARHGPSIMPGGSPEAYKQVRPILEAASAKAGGEPCVAWMGHRSAGNYVKTVHNGIEYALMQLIAEGYHYMKSVLQLPDEKIQQVFESWNRGVLGSYLMEITSDIFRKRDEVSGDLLLNRILDSARQKGTGKWTSQSAMDLEVPVPTLDMSVMVRNMSALKDQRLAAETLFPVRSQNTISEDADDAVQSLQNAVHFGFITVFAQGFALLSRASREYGYEVNLADVAKIWRGGCIIRADMLDDFMRILTENPDIDNLMLNKEIARLLSEFYKEAGSCVARAINSEVPLPALSASVSYFELYKSAWLPVNLIQAQRDYFGAHTYERTDREGTFHTDWKKPL